MDLALIDIDGVLADDSHRANFAVTKQWPKYFNEATMFADTPLENGRALIRSLQNAGIEVQYLTGRREDRRSITTRWLLDHGFPVAPIGMRSREEKMPLGEFKTLRITKMLETGNYDSIVLYDDDPEVIRLVQEAHGPLSAVHCTWYIKHPEMVRKATT